MSTDTGHRTTVDGMVIVTRFPWAAFNKHWHDELVAFARFHYEHPPAGFEVEQVVIDHVNVTNETFQPRIDLRPTRRTLARTSRPRGPTMG